MSFSFAFQPVNVSCFEGNKQQETFHVTASLCPSQRGGRRGRSSVVRGQRWSCRHLPGHASVQLGERGAAGHKHCVLWVPTASCCCCLTVFLSVEQEALGPQPEPWFLSCSRSVRFGVILGCQQLPLPVPAAASLIRALVPAALGDRITPGCFGGKGNPGSNAIIVRLLAD